MSMLMQFVFSFAVILFLMFLAGADLLGVPVGFGVVVAALVVSPFLAGGIVFGVSWLAEWSEQNARAKRIAKAKARKFKEG